MSFTAANHCNAHKRDGTICGQPAIVGRTKCRLHGGKTLAGAANGNYKHGRYSKVLPTRMAARYHEARVHPRLLSLSDDIAACEARLADLFQRVDSGENGALWSTVSETLEAFTEALAARDGPAMNQHLATLQQLVTQGREDYAAWHEIQSLWETRCKLTLTETKTLVSMQQMVSAEQLMLYFGVVTDAIQRIVPAHADPDTSRAILGALSTEFVRISDLEQGHHARPGPA